MKILHTSDWHLGHTLYNFDRTEEQKDMLQQIVKIVEECKPDLFLLCGDVYHTSQPSSAVQTMFSEAMVEIREANPDMTIIITAGNHDSGTKHEIFRTPWKFLNIHTIGNIDKSNIEEHIIKVGDKGYVIAVPYANERNIPEGFFQQLLDLVAQKNTAGLPVVMTAHTTVKGCDFRGHDTLSEATIGGIDSCDITQFGEGYDYFALGHIHHEQFIHTGNHNVRYSGTPIAVSFDEDYPHSVSIVEIENHGASPTLEKIEINNLRPLVTLPNDGWASWEEVIDLLKEYPDNRSDYIRLNVEIEDFLPVEARTEASQIAEEKKCKLCHINAKRKSQQNVSETKTLSVQEFQAESPIEIARRYAEDSGVNFDEDMEQLFNEVIKILNEESRND